MFIIRKCSIFAALLTLKFGIMIIKQVSVLIENCIGSSWKVFQAMADNNINILSYSIEDSPENGTLRLIVDNSRKAELVLNEMGLQIQMTKVYSMNVPNKTGSMSKVLKFLAEKNISIDFMYAFQYMGISQTVIHSADMDKLEETLLQYEQEQFA